MRIPEWLKTLVASRSFWSGLVPVIVAVSNLAGHPIGSDEVQAITVVVGWLSGFFGVTITRIMVGKPASYHKATGR